MRRDLKHAVGRCITDRFPGLQVLLAEFSDNVRAGGVTIAEDAGQGGLFQECVSELLRKAGLRLREVAPVEPNRNAGDFPMTGWRILSPGLLARAATLRANLAAIRQPWSLPSGGEAMSFTQSEFDKVGQVQGSLPNRVIGVTHSAGVGNMADRICAVIAIRGRVRRGADPHRVHDEDHGAHIWPSAGSNCG